MKAALVRVIPLAVLLAGAGWAQNSDLALLGGLNGPRSGIVSGATVTGTVGFAFQVNYAAQLHETVAGQLYLELPLLDATQIKGTVAGDVTANIGSSLFFTPGVRWRFTPQRRISFYAAAGAGLGSFGTSLSTVSAQMVSNTSTRTNTFAFGFGGGIDFRLTRLLSIRAEARDFITRDGLGGSSGPQHGFVMAGIGFHF